jgi:hypothetical protein
MSTATETRTWEPGDPLFERHGDSSVGWVRSMAEVVDDLNHCREGLCRFCDGDDVSHYASVMAVKFDGAP